MFTTDPRFKLKVGAELNLISEANVSVQTLDVNGTGAKKFYYPSDSGTYQTFTIVKARPYRIFYNGFGWVINSMYKHWINQSFSNSYMETAPTRKSVSASGNYPACNTIWCYNSNIWGDGSNGRLIVKFNLDVIDNDYLTIYHYSNTSSSAATGPANAAYVRPIYFRGAPIKAGVIKNGDIVTLSKMANDANNTAKQYYDVLSIDRCNDTSNFITANDLNTALSGNIYPAADDSYDIGSTSKKYTAVYALSFEGDCTGNAGSASKLTTTTKGSATKPVYFANGVPTECSYTLGAACAKDVSDSSSASAISTGTNLVTERDVYYGLPTINGAHNYNSGTNIYAPTAAGTSGQYLKSNGSGAPSWASLGAAASKNVNDSTSASALSNSGTNLVTERDVYYGLPTINGSHSYTSSTNIYAATSAGTKGQVLTSNGSGAPVWAAAPSGGGKEVIVTNYVDELPANTIYILEDTVSSLVITGFE